MNRNHDDNRLIEIDGETRTLTEWSIEYGISKQLVFDRLKRGWSEERSVTKPARKYKRPATTNDQ
jgi:hypothetical protein